MVEDLRVRVSAPGPGRGDQERHTEAQSQGTAARFVLVCPLQVLLPAHMFEAGVNAFGGKPCLRLVGVWGYEGWNMVEITVVLVVTKDEDRFLPQIRVLR